MTLETMISELHYTSDIEQVVLQKICKDEKIIEKIAETAYQGEDFDFALCRCMPLTRLAVVTYLLLCKYDDYKVKKIPDGIIFDTFRDVSLRAKLYYEKTGHVGISKGDVVWFRHIMNVAIFKIGALQFQPFEMLYPDEETIGEPYIAFTKEQKESLPPGAPVINCHIQQNADLSPEAVEASFDNAKRFFSIHFPVQYKAFLCGSWLPPQIRLKRIQILQPFVYLSRIVRILLLILFIQSFRFICVKHLNQIFSKTKSHSKKYFLHTQWIEIV